MKHLLICLYFLASSAISWGQSHVSWDFTFDADSQVVNLDASIDEGWHLYSQNKVNEFGPIPTSFAFNESNDYTLVGGTQEEDPIIDFDPNFEEELHFFQNATRFTQRVDVNSATQIEGIVTYMVCNDEMCMPPIDVEFTIDVTNEK